MSLLQNLPFVYVLYLLLGSMHKIFGGVAFETFLGDNFPQGGQFPGVNFSVKILQWGNFSELLYEILLMFCFPFCISILRVEILRVIVQGKFSPGLNCLENRA